MLNVIMPSVVLLSVVAPQYGLIKISIKTLSVKLKYFPLTCPDCQVYCLRVRLDTDMLHLGKHDKFSTFLPAKNIPA